MNRSPEFSPSSGRHGGGRRAAGRFGGAFADGGELGGRGLGMGRKLASADLKLLILGLLAEKPHHGYEIIKALEQRSKGFYAPSPGMVYPALTHLEEAGYATVQTEGNRKRCHITASGRLYLEVHRMVVDSLFTQFARVGERVESLRRAMQAGGRDRRAGDEARGSSPLMRARRALEMALDDRRSSSPQDQQRIARVLERALEEIGGAKPIEQISKSKV